MKERINISYIAGLFDGEGCISVGRTSSKYYYLKVRVSQKDPAILYAINELYPKSSVLKDARKGNDIYCHSLHFNNQTALEFLESIKDHCIIKYSQVILAIEYMKSDSITKYNLIPIIKTEKGKNLII